MYQATNYQDIITPGGTEEKEVRGYFYKEKKREREIVRMYLVRW